MPLTKITQDSAYRCSKCGHTMELKKGQLLPPCTRCGGEMEKFEGPIPEPQHKACS